MRLPDSELARRRSARLGSTCAAWLRPAGNAEGRGVIRARLKVQHQADLKGGTSARPATRCAWYLGSKRANRLGKWVAIARAARLHSIAGKDLMLAAKPG